jgi:hypothetical protein
MHLKLGERKMNNKILKKNKTMQYEKLFYFQTSKTTLTRKILKKIRNKVVSRFLMA